MDDELMHELAAGYALDALGPDDERAYEEHLARCTECRADVAGFATVAAALAHGAPPAEPRPELRARVLVAARAERVEPAPRRRRSFRVRRPAFAFAAVAAAACAAVAVATFVAVQGHRNDGSIRALALRGASGSVVVSGSGSAVLVVSGLPRAAAGKTYEAWVMRVGRRPDPAALFAGGAATARVKLAEPIPAGSFVGVTLEPAGGTTTPTGPPVATSDTA